MPGEANETYVPFMSVLTAFKSTLVSPGTTARTYFVVFLPILTHQNDALGRLGKRVTTHRTDDFRSSLGRMVNQPILHRVPIKERDQLRVGIS